MTAPTPLPPPSPAAPPIGAALADHPFSALVVKDVGSVRAALCVAPTLHGGIRTCVPDDSTNAESMVMRADHVLHAAKVQGRNRCFSFEMPMDTVEQLNG